MDQISRYFGTVMTKLDISDWDEVEKTVKAVIKSSRAGKNFNAD